MGLVQKKIRWILGQARLEWDRRISFSQTKRHSSLGPPLATRISVSMVTTPFQTALFSSLLKIWLHPPVHAQLLTPNKLLLMNIAKLMKQAQQMQAGLAAKQEELSIQTVEASVGGGKVHVIATCAGDVLSIKIDPSVIDPSDAEFLEDLVLKGVQEAIAKGKEKSAAEMKKLTGGLNIPGM
jgi:DNA-binding YbaB/EbfC family protein